MSTELPPEKPRDYEIPCKLLPVAEFDMSESIPSEQRASVPVGGFLRNDTVHDTTEIDFSQDAMARGWPAIPKNDSHMVQLDGLRAFAVLGVFAHHTLPPHLIDWAGPGQAGVRLFFVLSGFLITKILLRSRASAQDDGQSRGHVMLAFYGRRFLRIFPLYYAVLTIAIAIGIPIAIASALWHWIYLTNLYSFLTGEWPGPLAHFWSLAVEEQFYLVWPALVLFAPRQYLGRIFAVVILAAPVFRIVLFRLTFTHFVTVLTPACLDTLGIGALLAFFWESRPQDQIDAFCRRCLAAGVAMLVVLKTLQITGNLPTTIDFGLMDTGLALVFVWVVNRAGRGFRGPVGAVLTCRPIVYLGTISYGLYVWHHFAAAFTAHAAQHWGIPISFPPVLGAERFLFVAAFSIIAATVSWFALEKPILKLKPYIPYSRL